MDKPLNMTKPGHREYSRSDLVLITKKTREIVIDLNVLALDNQKYLGYMIGRDNVGKKNLDPSKKIDISDSYKMQPGQKVKRPIKAKPWSTLNVFDAMDHIPEGFSLKTFLDDGGK